MSEIKGGLWRDEIRDKAGRLRAEVMAFGSDFAPGTGPEFFEANVSAPLDAARESTEKTQRLAEWWSGALVERAWRDVRLAEESLIRATPDRDRLGWHAERALVRAAKLDTDGGVEKLRSALKGEDPEAVRDATLSLLQTINPESALRHQAQRRLRNRLRVTTICLALSAVALLLAAVLWPGFPNILTAASECSSTAASKCSDVSMWLPLAMVAGVVGAVFSALPSLAVEHVAPSSFDTTTQQALFKIVVGAWSGPVGMIAVTAGLGASGETNATTAGFLMTAALFGAGQEALTRFADKKASDAAPS